MYVVTRGMDVSLTEALLCTEIKGWVWRGGVQGPAEAAGDQAARASGRMVRVKDFSVRAMGRNPRIWVIL